MSKRKSKKGNPFGAGEKGIGREGLNLAKHGRKSKKKSSKREAKREKGRY